MAEYLEDGFWSEDTCKLTDIIEDLPTLVRVSEGIYGGNEATSFSQGDLIKIDACKPMTRVTAHLTQPGSNIKYEKYGSEISLPYHYNGRVRVEPLHGEYYKYKSVKDLIEYFPRNIRVLGNVVFKDPTGKTQTLKPGTTLELKAVRKNKSGFATSLRCETNGQDIVLPRDASGVFQVLPDDTEQTIRDVVENYKLPQCVRFIGRGVQEIMSKDIQEAIHNLTTYSGELILTGKVESAPVLFGHYKGLGVDDASSQFCHRSAVVIPLDTPEITDIDVRLPAYLDASDYELFILKNFSQSTSTPQFLEGALYADFTRSRKVQFISESTPPAIPPRPKPREPAVKEESPHTPPPVPERPKRSLKPTQTAPSQSEYLNMAKESPKLKPKKSPPRVQPVRSMTSTAAKPQSPKSPRQIAAGQPSFGASGLGLGLGSLISEAFTKEDTEEGDIYEATETYSNTVPLPIAQKKHKQHFKKMLLDLVHKVRLDRGGDPSLGLEPPELEDDVEYEVAEDDVTYDYIDEEVGRELFKKFNPKPTLMVSPSCRPIKTEAAGHDLKEMTISELEAVFTSCGMTELAKVCKRECIDGVLFESFTPDILKKKPFSLSEFKIQKVNEIKNGWRPKT